MKQNNQNELDYLKRQIRVLEEKLKRQRPAERPFEQPIRQQSKSPTKSFDQQQDKEIIIRTVHTYDPSMQSENAHALRQEVEQWRTRYNYVVNENLLLNKLKSDLEVELQSFHKEMDRNGEQIINENKQLRNELTKLQNSRGQSPNKTDIRVENKLNLEIQRLRKDNEKLKE